MQTQHSQPEVIIIGGGLAGLTAATYLARAGTSVTLYEKASTLGGRASSQNEQGYQFNRGIHALYCGGATEHVLNELNIPYSGNKPTGISVLHRGKLYLAPVDLPSLLKTNYLNPLDKLELLRVFMSIPGLDAHEHRYMSAQEWLDKNVRRPTVHQFLATNARTLTYTAALDLVSAEVFINKTQLSIKNPIIYLDGGWQTLVDGLRKAAENAGAKIVSSAHVESVEVQNGHVEGVRLRSGEMVSASSVILATNPHDAAKLGGPAVRKITQPLIPLQIASLDVALSRLPDLAHPIVQDVSSPRFMSTQSVFSKVAPAGTALVYTFKQLDPTHPSDPHDDERDLENLLDTAQPGWRDLVVHRQYLPRIEAVGALPTATSGGFAGRPDIDASGIDGLYLAGDWVGADGFLADASMASAKLAAQRILEGERAFTSKIHT